MTKSLHMALADLKLDRAWIVYPGRERYAIHKKVEVVPLREIQDCLRFTRSAAVEPRRLPGR